MTLFTISLVTLGDPGRLTGGYLYHQRMAELAPRFGARIEFVSFPDRPFPLPALSGQRVLRSVKISGAQAIVLDSIAAAYLGPWLVFTPRGLPVVAMLHQPPGGIGHGRIRSVLQRWLDRLAYDTAVRLLVAGDYLRDELVRDGMPGDRIVVVPPGRDVAATAPVPAGDLRRGRSAAFLCVANWLENKGIHTLLDAFASLPAGDATLHLVGDDHADPRYTEKVRRRLAQPDLTGRVIAHGPASREQVAGFYEAADVFVMVSARETYGTVFGEAMAAGLPVVGWRSDNLPYLATDGREGILLPPGDVAELTAALHRLAVDEAWRSQLGEAAARRASARPTWQDTAALFVGTIRDVV